MKRVILLGLGLFCVGACGGADQSSLLADGGNTTGNDGGGIPDATGPEDTGPGPDVIIPDDVTVVDVVTVDVPVGPPDSKIHCGASLTCDAKTEICCHHAPTSIKQYECVASVNNCAGTGDVPIACSSNDNCISQGQPSYVCCANIGAQGVGNCSNSAVATDVSCQADCTQQDQVPVGCDTQLQNCADPQAQCITSVCTLPGYNICI